LIESKQRELLTFNKLIYKRLKSKKFPSYPDGDFEADEEKKESQIHLKI